MASESETGRLHVIDSRTEKEYDIPILDNYIRATDLAAIAIQDQDLSHKLRILDNGYQHTACMRSEITHIDGQRGEIRYRGFPIQNVFRNNDFEDVLHLLIWSRFPTDGEKQAVRIAINTAAVPPQSVKDTIAAFPRDADTYPIMVAALSAYIAADKHASSTRHQQTPVFHGNLEEADKSILRSIGYFASAVAMVQCHKRGISFTEPEPNRPLVDNLLLMMGVQDPKTGTGPDPTITACLNKLWILYADHEMTNSTASMLHVTSTLTDPTSGLIAALISAYGPLHGGAIDLAYEALEKIKHPKNVPIFIELIKAKKARLYGYGHRIYRTRDPRLALIEQLIDQNKEAVTSNALLQVALAIDAVASKDEYFVSRNLHANADLLGCFLYSALGFERDIITAIIALSRVPGVLAHWRETLSQPIKLWRPLQIYSGTKHEPHDSDNNAASISSEEELAQASMAKVERSKGMKVSFRVKARQLRTKVAVAWILKTT